MKKQIFLKFVTIIFLCITQIINNNKFQYSIFIILLIIYIIQYFIKSSHGRLLATKHDFIPLIIILIWLYGIVIGIIRGNDIKNVFSNYAGMIIYIYYYLFIYKKVTKEWLFRILYISAFLSLIITIIKINKKFIWSIRVGELERYYYSEAPFLMSIMVFVLLMSFIVSKADYNIHFRQNELLMNKYLMLNILFYLLGSYCVAFAPASKGSLLGYICLTLLMPTIYYCKPRRGRSKMKYAIFMLVAAIISIILNRSVYKELAINIFTAEEGSSNRTRIEQMEYIYKDINLIGNGLGATLKSGYERDIRGYGFETSYINLIHKFGVMSLLLFYIYGITIFKAAKNIFQGKQLKYSSAAIGAMLYLFSAIGNPLIFSPTCSLLHCAALYLIRKDYSTFQVGRNPL